MSRYTGCPGFRTLSRRGVLQVGGLGALGFGLSDLLRAQAAQAAEPVPAAAPRAFGKANSVILIWLSGGPSHQDLWDIKPDAPAELRGEFKPIKTNVPGIDVSELLPRVAKHADKYADAARHHPDRGRA